MDNRPRILLVEDDATIRRFVRIALQAEGYELHEAEGLQRALIDAATRRPELVLLDLGLPDGDGLDFIREFRSWSQAAVVVLSARDAEAQKVRALDLGADDYLVKPFGVPELLARLRVQLRRQAQGGSDAPLLAFGDFVLDRGERRLIKRGEPLHLTPIEYRLLTALAAQPGRVLTHAQLLTAVWGPGHQQDHHYLRVHLANLRKKLEDDPAAPRWLQTETGVGYRLLTDAA
jgi:two-component system, OmpR family, KDP operon response regulator KdpE